MDQEKNVNEPLKDDEEIKVLLEWDKIGERLYETGVEQGALFVAVGATYPKGVAWNGLTKVSEKPTGAETTSLYANDSKYVNLVSNEEFEASVEAYTYPDEFEECDGSKELTTGVKAGQQARKTFGLAYKTMLANDTEGIDHGYKLHIIYGATASPSEKDYSTINDSPEAITFTWELKTTPVSVTGGKPTASLVIDSTKVDAAKMKALEQVIYGTPGDESKGVDPIDARLPLPDEIVSIIKGQ